MYFKIHIYLVLYFNIFVAIVQENQEVDEHTNNQDSDANSSSLPFTEENYESKYFKIINNAVVSTTLYISKSW